MMKKIKIGFFVCLLMILVSCNVDKLNHQKKSLENIKNIYPNSNIYIDYERRNQFVVVDSSGVKLIYVDTYDSKILSIQQLPLSR